ncbi:tyrosine-type recombinase/integrase [Streptomyces sp. NPDC101175]|uniref:tyrosine-type recombinase/integrase n=1 Tax=Streptomyces sp. NPDC101175 TaxID=3366123 RepID=UPI003838C7E4
MARSNGEGTFYQRKDGRWEAAAYFQTVSGQRKRRRFYGVTKDEARQKLIEEQARAQSGIRVPDRTWKLSDYLDHWLERAKRRPLTYKRQESVVRLHLKPGLGHHRLDKLSVKTIQDFLDRLQQDGKSAATTYQVRKVLSAALTHAMRQEIIIRNVARLVELPEYRPEEAQYWTPAETVRFLEAAKTDPLYPAFVLLALYGLRRGEVLGIRWRDVDFELGALRIRQQVQRIDGKLQLAELKTNSSQRDEPLQAVAQNVLEAQLIEQRKMRLAAGATWKGSRESEGLVFTTKTGSPIESRNLYRSFLRICEQNGLRRITIHGLRHSNATTLKNLDVHDRNIQAILGHGDVRTTGIYQHVDMDSKRNALAKVEQTLFFRSYATSDKARCRQKLPSNRKKLHRFGEVFFGGSSQTRTGDTRLFRPIQYTLNARLTEVKKNVDAHRRKWLLGAVAVNVAVKTNPSKEVTYEQAA